MNSNHFGTTITANKLLSLDKCVQNTREQFSDYRAATTQSLQLARRYVMTIETRKFVFISVAQLLEFIVYLMMTVNFCTAPNVPGLFGPLETP